jgi:hypothetical protein
VIDIDKWLDTQRQDTTELLEKAEHLKKIMTEAQCSATSSDQCVTVTVGPAGTLLGLRFSPHASDLSMPLITSRIMEAYHAACRVASAQTLSTMEQVAGPESSILEFFRTTMPNPQETENDDLEAESWRG